MPCQRIHFFWQGALRHSPCLLIINMFEFPPKTGLVSGSLRNLLVAHTLATIHKNANQALHLDTKRPSRPDHWAEMIQIPIKARHSSNGWKRHGRSEGVESARPNRLPSSRLGPYGMYVLHRSAPLAQT